jgi:UDP-glucose 4-epimerase
MTDILVTGGGGFVGHQLVSELLENEHDARVFVLDNFTFGKRTHIPVSARVEVLECDLRDRSRLLHVIGAHAFDVVFHLAALHFIPYCNAHPAECLEANIIGTRNLFEALRRQERLRLLSNTSTMAVYAISDQPHREDVGVAPMDVYGRSKLAGEDLARLFHLDTGVPTITWRLTNAVGSNETNEHLFPTILKQLLAGARTVHLGNLEPRRNYIDTRDVSRIMRAPLRRLLRGYTVANLGSETELSVREVVQLFEECLQEPIAIDQDPQRVRPVERQRLQPAISRMLEIAEPPRYSLRESVMCMLADAGLVKNRT